MKLSNNQIYDIVKFCEIIFRKNGDWRYNAFRGIEVYSQFLLKCFGKSYRRGLIQYLLDGGYLRIVSDDYSNYSGNEFCKIYAVTPKGARYYDSLKNDTLSNEFTASRSKQRIRKFLEDSFFESVDYTVVSKKDNRVHSPWCIVPKDQRHSFVSSKGDRLLFDMDKKTAYPAMFLEMVDGMLWEEVDGSGWVGGGLVGYGCWLQCMDFQAFKNEVSDFRNLFRNGDFYLNLKNLLKIELNREEIKEVIMAVFNSTEKQRKFLSKESKQFVAALETRFPFLNQIILTANDRDDGTETFLGGILADKFEYPIIWGIREKLKQTGLFTHLIPIYDGIEVWGMHATDEQRQTIRAIIQEVLSGYSYITMNVTETGKG